MRTIQILRAVLVEGAHVDQGAQLEVGIDISKADADMLVRHHIASDDADYAAEPMTDDPLSSDAMTTTTAAGTIDGGLTKT